MNNINIKSLEQEKQDILHEKYGLGLEDIQDFQSHIKRNEEEANKLGEELFNLISKKDYDEEQSIEKVVELIYNGANLEYKNQKKGDYALLICARKNLLATFLVLVKAGANINQVNNFLTTATMAAARHGCLEILECLILLGANVNAKCLDGYTAIMSAKKHNQVECFNMLVSANCSLNNRDIMNNSMMNIQSEESFDLTTLCKDFEMNEIIITTEDDVSDLIKKAQEEKKAISSNIYLDEPKKRIRTNNSNWEPMDSSTEDFSKWIQ